MPALCHRRAETGDIPALRALMARAIRAHLAAYLPPEGVEASFAIMGLDTQLIADRTYYVIEIEGAVAGCGGWSRRATLFGGDHSAGRDAALLNPVTDAARIRAMYTHPDQARRGVGRRILELCEADAAREGFTALELAATLSGLPLYRAFGFAEEEAFVQMTASGYAVPLVRMRKVLA